MDSRLTGRLDPPPAPVAPRRALHAASPRRRVPAGATEIGLALGLALLTPAPATQADLVVSWDLEDEPLGTSYGIDGEWTGKAGTSAPHATFGPSGSAGASPVVLITTTGATPSGYTKVVDNAADRGFTADTLNNEYGGLDKSNTTFDLFLSPDSFSGGRQTLFESGGNGAGLGIALIDNAIVFASNNKTAASVDLTPLYGSSPVFDDFLHVRAAVNLDEDSLELSVRNLGTGLIATDQTDDYNSADWAGSDGSGLLSEGGTFANPIWNQTPGANGAEKRENLVGFDGQFAALLIYDDALPAIPEPAATALLSLGMGLVLSDRRHRHPPPRD